MSYVSCPLFSLITLCIILFPLPQISAVGSFPLNVWPEPTTFLWPNPQAIALSPNFTISAPPHRYLAPAVARYLGQILTEHHRPLVDPDLNLTSAPPLAALTVTISDSSAPLAHGVNESYTLTVPCGGGDAVLAAETAWGAMRGLETLSQLVYANPPRLGCGLYISDVPLFMHRGVMLDTSRNYYGVEDLVRLIGAMSMNKLNVFHWHVTDSHSFPLVVPSAPAMAEKGAYGDDMVYTAADVQRVVEFGLEHGVRVMPEIDMPGEFGLWISLSHFKIIYPKKKIFILKYLTHTYYVVDTRQLSLVLPPTQYISPTSKWHTSQGSGTHIRINGV